MITIVADESIPFLQGVLEPWCRMVYKPGQGISKADLSSADGMIIRTRTTCDKALLEGTPVHFIATATIGFDHIDTGYCDGKGIRWFHAAGCNSGAVAQYIACCLINLAIDHNFELSDKTLGVIGIGNVGNKVVQIARSLGMSVLQNDPPRQRAEGGGEYAGLEELLRNSDIVTLHVPLTKHGPDSTLHLAGEEFFNALPQGSFIINTSRGAVVSENALIKHLRSKRLGGAVLDVWEKEPGINREVLALTEIGTPHIAGYSTEGKANGTAYCVRRASQFFGFGLDDWYPASLPLPPTRETVIETYGKSLNRILLEGLTASYDIMRDDRQLRLNPGQFEALRNKYPVRREFPAHRIKLTAPHKEAERIFSELGFGV